LWQAHLPYRLTKKLTQVAKDIERICECIYANTELCS
jgi:hypothetical protein